MNVCPVRAACLLSSRTLVFSLDHRGAGSAEEPVRPPSVPGRQSASSDPEIAHRPDRASRLGSRSGTAI